MVAASWISRAPSQQQGTFLIPPRSREKKAKKEKKRRKESFEVEESEGLLRDEEDPQEPQDPWSLQGASQAEPERPPELAPSEGLWDRPEPAPEQGSAKPRNPRHFAI